MAKGKKAKWLEEATTRELIVLLKECMEDDTKKAKKIIKELLERVPEEETDGNLTIEEVIKTIKNLLDSLTTIYNQEVASIVEEDEDDEEEDEDEEDEEEDEEDEEEEEEDYEDMSSGELKKEMRRRGIKVTKSMKKADMVKALEADDED